MINKGEKIGWFLICFLFITVLLGCVYFFEPGLFVDDYLISEYNINQIECANNEIIQVISKINYKDRKAEYKFLKNDTVYMIARHETAKEENLYKSTFSIYNSREEKFQTLNWESRFLSFFEVNNFRDFNQDGHIDVQVIMDIYPSNEICDLYIWNEENDCFEKVIYDGMLAEIDINDKKLYNWGRSGKGQMLQILEWQGNELIKVSEEYVEPE